MVKLIPNNIIFKHSSIVDLWILGKFIVNYDIDFFTNGNFIERYIATASVDPIVTYFSLQYKY